ncbi:hypothetical protein BKA83DRAFT_4273144 [Pisolithus microcarpus]|nr:hypothetical protein BKA83DRAFT_4273144 [Pisolithus microcarpus]
MLVAWQWKVSDLMAGIAGCVLTGLTCNLHVGGMAESEWFGSSHRCICIDWAHLHSMLWIAADSILSHFCSCICGVSL